MDEIGKVPLNVDFIAPLVDSLDVGLVVIDKDGRFQIWNDATTKVLGKGPAVEIPADEWAAFYGLHCPLEQRLLTLDELPLYRALSSAQRVDQEIILINEAHPEGCWIRVSARPIFRGKELAGALAVTTDVTNEKASLLANQMMSWFFDASDDGIVGVNLDGTILLWNPGAERLFGYSADDIIGQSVYRLVVPERASEIDRLVQKAREAKPLPPQQATILRKDNTLVEIYRSITLIRDSHGSPIGAVVVARDISRLKRAERQLADSREQLRLLSNRQQTLLEQQLRQLARELHDELGQQLAAMKFELAWLERHMVLENEKVEERFLSLNGLLDSTIAGLRRVSKQMRPPLLEELGLCHAVGELLSNLSGRYPIRTTYDCHCRHLQFDPEAALAIYRIIQEALTNVVRHAHATQVTVRLILDGDQVLASVEDDGRGIPLTPPAGGANFGILGMQERARSWSGVVEVAPAPQGGTHVRAVFPHQRVLG
jgi:PAS domain S-box-containing protein